MHRLRIPLVFALAGCGSAPPLEAPDAGGQTSIFDAGPADAPDAGPADAPDAGTADAGLLEDAGAGRSPLLSSVPCRLSLPSDLREGSEARCYDLETHEDPRDPATPEVEVHVVVLAPEAPGLPVVVLQGGPGLLGEAYLPHLGPETRSARFGDRPIVHVEQRGVGASRPALSCAPGETQLECRRRWTDAEGRALARFGTREAAQDVLDAVRGLGFESWLLAGGSYGSRWALEVLREAPASLRGVYLESLVPPDVSYLEGFIEGTDAALDRLFARCAQDAVCTERHPSPENTLAQAFRVAAEENLPTPFGAISPLILGFGIVEAQYHQDLLGSLLDGLAAVAAEDRIRANAWFRNVFSRPPQVARFLNQVVLCADIASLDDPTRRRARLDAVRPALRAPLDAITSGLGTCEAEGFPSGDPVARQPVTASVPVLLVIPELDARTPDANAERVARTLPGARFARLEGRAHTPGLGFQNEGRALDACAGATLRTFLSDPDEAQAPSCGAEEVLDFGPP